MDNAELEFRKVTLEDIDQILAIRKPGDVYYGYDYLPDDLPLLLKQDGNHGYVAVINNQFIAFYLAFMVDEGETLVTRAGRVAKDYEGKNINRALRSFVLQHHSPKKHVSTFVEENKGMLKQLSNGNYRLINKRDILHFKIDRSTMESTVREYTENGFHSTRRINNWDMTQIFQSSTTCSKLFPDDIIVCNWVPFKLLESNIPLLFYERTTFIGTFNGTECTLITVGTYTRCERGFLFFVEIFGDQKSINEHILLHLGHIKKTIEKDELHIFMFCNKQDIDGTEEINKSMKGFGFREEKCFPYTCFIAEKAFENMDK